MNEQEDLAITKRGKHEQNNNERKNAMEMMMSRYLVALGADR